MFWYTGSTLANPKLRSTVLSLLTSRGLDHGEENIFEIAKEHYILRDKDLLTIKAMK